MKKHLILILLIFFGLPLIGQTFGNAIELDGTNDYAIVPHHPSLNPGDGSWSVAFWLKAADKPQISPVVMKRYPAPGYTMYAYCFGSGDPHNADYGRRIRINHIDDAGITERSGTTTCDYIDGDWHQYVIIADKSKNGIVVYVDGQIVEFTHMYHLGSWPNVANENPLYIARGSSETFIEGTLDELSIWNKAISAELVQKMQIDTLSLEYYNSVDSGLVAYYRFDQLENSGSGNGGSDDIRDLSFYQNHADTEGEPVLVESTILPSNNAALTQIQINSENLKSFTAATLKYNVELPVGTTIVPTISTSPVDANANIEITQASGLPGTATILVTAEDNETQQTYSVVFTVAKNNDTTLRSILIDNKILDGFNTNTLEYTVEESTSTNPIPTVSANPTDTNATIEITQTPQLPGTATILVTAEDNETQQTYSVVFTIPTSTVDFSLKNTIKLYPNPVGRKFKIQSSKFKVEGALIEIYNLNGDKLLQKLISKGTETTEIDVSSFPNGIYFCKLCTENESVTKKLIIQK